MGAVCRRARIFGLIFGLITMAGGAPRAAQAGDAPPNRITVVSEGPVFRQLPGTGAGAMAVAEVTLALDADWPVVPAAPEGVVLLSPASERVDSTGLQVDLVRDQMSADLARLTIRLPVDRLPVPGNYRVALRVRVPAAPARGAATLDSQRLTLVLGRPEAKLAALPALVFDPWHTFLPRADGDVSLDLPFTETAGRAGVAGAVQVESATGPDGQPVWPALRCSEVRLPPGTSSKVICSVPAAAFELGSTKVGLIVRAPALVAPLEGSVEVRHRRPGCLIVIVILAGLLLGYVTRVVLTAVIKDCEARAAAVALGLEISAAAGHADTTFQTTVQPGLKALEDALTTRTWPGRLRGTKDPLGDATKLATLLSQSAATSLDQRRTTEATAVADLRRTATKDWIVPKQIAAVLQTVRDRLDAANAEPDLTKRRTAREQAQKELTDSVKDTLLEWPSQLQQRIDAVDRALPPDLEMAHDGWQQLGHRRQALALMTIDVEHFDAVMRRLSVLGRAIIEELRLMGVRIDGLSTSIADRLAAAGVAGDVVGQVRALGAATADTFAAEPGNFEDVLAAAPAALSSFAATLSALLKSLMPQGEKSAIAAALDAGRFAEGTGLIGAHVHPGGLPDQRAVDRRGAGSLGGTALLKGVTSFAHGPIGIGALDLGFPMQPAFSLLRGLVTRTRRRPAQLTTANLASARSGLFRAKLIQFVILAVLTEAIGYCLLCDRFVGQASELAAIVGWSFAIDLSTDVVTNLAKGLLKA